MAYDPFLSTNPLVDALEAHRGKVEQTRENTARLAQAFASYETTGDGEIILNEPYLFGCTFIERPTTSYGFALNEAANAAGIDVQFGKLPQASGGVREWVKDGRGYYTGCYVFFSVRTQAITRTTPVDPDEDPAPVVDPTAATPNYVIDHDFMFSGIAIKDVPAYLLEPGSVTPP